MTGPRHFPLRWWLAWLGVAVAQGAEEPSRKSEPRLRAEIREAIAARLPAFAPTPVEEEGEAARETSDNLLILPKMTIRRPLQAPLNDTGWLTPTGRLAVAMRRYPGSRLGNVFGLNDAATLEKFNADEAARKKSELKERVDDLLRLQDDEAIRKHTKRALALPNLEWAGVN